MPTLIRCPFCQHLNAQAIGPFYHCAHCGQKLERAMRSCVICGAAAHGDTCSPRCALTLREDLDA